MRIVRKIKTGWARLFAQPPSVFQEMNYDAYWKERSRNAAIPKPRHQLFLKWLKQCPHQRILDVGCGDGVFARLAQDTLKVKVFCIDISKTAVELAKAKGLEAQVVDVENDSIPGEYDVAVLSEFIEHLANPEKALLRLKRHARYFFISIPNIAFIEHRVRLLFGRFPIQWAYYPGEHLRFWSIADILHLLRGLGFKVEEIRASDGVPVLKDILPNLFGENICFRLKVK
ncbi:MAG: methyltransferase domain-containing protein [Candidatus Omnitrophota bacterium]